MRSGVDRGVLVGLILGPFVALLDLSIVTVALPQMGRDLHTDASGQQWVIDSYAVCLAALLLSGGSLSDRFGRKRAYLIGIGVFTVASAGCAVAPDIGWLIAARAVQGGAAALVMTGALSLLVQAFPDPRERARMMGINGTIGGSSIVLGPLVGGVIVDGADWRWIFVINVPIGVVAVWSVARSMPESADPEHAALDPLGQLLGLVLLGSLTYGLIESRDNGWTSAATVLPLTVAVCSAVSFILLERRASSPMLPMTLFRERAFTVPNICSFVLGFGTSAIFVLFSLYLQQVQGRSPLAVGLLFVPLSGAICAVAPFTGRLVGRAGPLPVIAVGYAVAGVGLLGLLALGIDTTVPLLVVFGLVLGAGMGASIGPTQLAAVLALPRERSGLASACVATTRQGGTAIGVAVLGLIIATAAGRPDRDGYASGFVSGMHTAGLVAGVLTLACAGLAAWAWRREAMVVAAEPVGVARAR